MPYIITNRPHYTYVSSRFNDDMLFKLKMAGYPIPCSPAPVANVDVPPGPMTGRKTRPSIDPASPGAVAGAPRATPAS